ncbi:MAG: response regulator [Candidatus Krumholzibacteria bacterium]|nr:response regulator [Candidatus Krumholzibacteria bacterium]
MGALRQGSLVWRLVAAAGLVLAVAALIELGLMDGALRRFSLASTESTDIPLEALSASTAQLRQHMILIWAAVSVFGLAALAVVLYRTMRPLRSLRTAAVAIADGDFQAAITSDGSGEIGTLSRALEQMRQELEHRLTASNESEERYRLIFDTVADSLLLVDQDGSILAANPQTSATYGWSPQQISGRSFTCLLRAEDRELAQILRNPPADRPVTVSGQTCDREGRERETEIRAVRLTYQGKPTALILLRDMTAQRRLERQLLQSQKLESVGRLAGGVAHDFNNLLTPVLGYSEMLLTDTSLSEDVRTDLKAIQRAGERARKLARQLLAFSHRQVVALQDIDLSRAVRDFTPILRQTLREDIELRCHWAAEPCPVRADLSQIEQILMNLAVNAMDALPNGGCVELQVAAVTLPAADLATPDRLPAGPYACLRVRDNGPGIPPAMLGRVCEPFFTTKEAGKGAGLGLATVHGIVTQHNGWLSIANHRDGGCEVTILLPRLPAIAAETEAAEDKAAGREPDGRGKTILVVEDDGMVRRLVESLLIKHGYQVRAYANGVECLDDLAAQPQPADLLLTDVVMPGLNGPELRERLHASGYSLPTLFISGYAGETLSQRRLATGSSDYLQKPLSPELLLRKLRQMLAKAPGLRPTG